jgi:hypothetical protein
VARRGDSRILSPCQLRNTRPNRGRRFNPGTTGVATPAARPRRVARLHHRELLVFVALLLSMNSCRTALQLNPHEPSPTIAVWAADPTVAVVLGTIEEVTDRHNLLSVTFGIGPSEHRVSFRIKQVRWIGDKLKWFLSIPPRIRETYWANRQRDGDRLRCGEDYWLVLTQFMSSPPRIVAWEHVKGSNAPIERTLRPTP